MAGKRKTVWLGQLTLGICEDNIVVNVDRIISIEHVRQQFEYELPSTVPCRYEIVVFDESPTRMVLEMDSDCIWYMFAGKFGEDHMFP